MRYSHIPYFWTKMAGKAEFVGFLKGADWYHTETIVEGLPEKSSRITYFFKGSRCIGAATINTPGAAVRLMLALENGLMPNRDAICSGKSTYYDIALMVDRNK